jgi:alpha-ribazole phosphatase/probable phosphoglycerate mutase
MTVKRVIFIRPGETDWNRQKRWQGWVAVPLNEHGRRQAQRLANYIRNIGMSVLYTSDLKRAIETADLLAEKLGYAPIPDERLRERNIGSWQGLTPDEMSQWYPAEYGQLLADHHNFRVPGGESRNDVKKRILVAFNDIVAQDKGETIGIMSHTTAIHELLSELIPGTQADNVGVSNTSVTTIARGEDGHWRLVASDDITHLEGLETRISAELEDKK